MASAKVAATKVAATKVAVTKAAVTKVAAIAAVTPAETAMPPIPCTAMKNRSEYFEKIG